MIYPKSDKLNKKNVILAFYKPITFSQKIKAYIGGINVCSISLLIENKLYQFRKKEKYMQERNYTLRYLKKYILIDTDFKIKDLKGKWKSSLLSQKARNWDRLFIRLRCVKALGPVINQLGEKWKYRYGDLLSSIYLKRRYEKK